MFTKLFLLRPGSILLCLVMLLLGCHDGDQALAPVADETLAARAQRAFESEVLLSHTPVNAENPRGYMAKTPQWAQAYPIELSVGQGLIVPVYYDQPFYLTSNISGKRVLAANAVTNLLVYTGGDGKFRYELLSSFPEADKNGKFTGIIYVEDWYGNTLKHYQYRPDGAINLLKPAAGSSASDGKMQTIQVCYYYTVWNHSVDDPQGYSYDVLIGCEYYTVDTGGSSGGPTGGDYGSGGGGPPSGGGPSPCDPLIAARAPAPCDGQTPTGPQPIPPKPEKPGNIVNDVDDPCAHAQVKRLTGSSGFIRFMFNSNEYMNLKYVMGNLGTSVDAIDAETGEQRNGPYRTIQTTLNRNRIVGASDEYIMATLIHEMYHAQQTAMNHASAGNAADHVYMTEHFDEMVQMLQRFFPGMSTQAAQDLTWGGLGETPAWGALDAAEQNRIKNVNTDYRRAAKGRSCADLI